METIKLTEQLCFSRIVQGFWRLTDWHMDTRQLIAFMQHCIDRGVTTFDTAEIYADTLSEIEMGKAFKAAPELRSKIQLVSKTGIFKAKTNGGLMGYYDTTYNRVIQSCKESLQRLQTDYLDLYLIHREDPCIDHAQTAGALKELKKQGYIKEAGVSNFDPYKLNALNSFMDGTLATNQIEWNPVCFEHFDNGMMDLLQQNKIHPMIWSPLCGGQLFTCKDNIYKQALSKLEEIARRHNADVDTIVYAYILYHPVKALPISGSQKPERLDNAIKALDIQLEHSEWYEIYTASQQKALR